MSVLLRVGSAAEGVIASLWNEIVFVSVFHFLPYSKDDPITARLVHVLIVTLILSMGKQLCLILHDYDPFGSKNKHEQ